LLIETYPIRTIYSTINTSYTNRQITLLNWMLHYLVRNINQIIMIYPPILQSPSTICT